LVSLSLSSLLLLRLPSKLTTGVGGWNLYTGASIKKKKSQVRHQPATGTYVTHPKKVTNVLEEGGLGSRGRNPSKVGILVQLSEISTYCSYSGCAV